MALGVEQTHLRQWVFPQDLLADRGLEMKVEGFCHHLPSSSLHFGGGGLVLAHTMDRSRFCPCQLCPVLQLLSVWEIPRERRAEVGLSPLNHLALLPFRLTGPIALVHLCLCSLG